MHTKKKKTPFHDAIRLPLAAPNHHAIRFFSADTFEPGGAVCFNGRGGNPPPKPVVRWLKVGTYGESQSSHSQYQYYQHWP